MTFRTLALIGATILFVSPAFGQQPAQAPPGQPAGQAEVSDEDMQQYVQALNEMAPYEPAVVVALQGDGTVEVAWIDTVSKPETQQALQSSGLTKDEFREITKEIHEDPQVKQQYQQTLRQMAGKPGEPGSASGAAPSSSPSGTSGATPGAQPGASPQ